MVRSVYSPEYLEDIVYNTNDITEWQLDRTAVLGQGSRSGQTYLLEFDKDNTLVECYLQF